MTLSLLRNKLGFCSCKGCWNEPISMIAIFPTNSKKLFYPMKLCNRHGCEAIMDHGLEKVRLI